MEYMDKRSGPHQPSWSLEELLSGQNSSRQTEIKAAVLRRHPRFLRCFLIELLFPHMALEIISGEIGKNSLCQEMNNHRNPKMPASMPKDFILESAATFPELASMQASRFSRSLAPK